MALRQILIAFDQLINTLAGGWADETLSARVYRNREKTWAWWLAYVVINVLFIWQENHCRDAWLAERLGRQLPVHYRDTRRT